MAIKKLILILVIVLVVFAGVFLLFYPTSTAVYSSEQETEQTHEEEYATDEYGLAEVGEFEDTRLADFPVFIDEIADEYDEFLEQFDYVHHMAINEMPPRQIFYFDNYFRLELLQTHPNFHENSQDISENIPIFNALENLLEMGFVHRGMANAYSILVTALSPLSSVEFIGVSIGPLFSANPVRVYFEIGNLDRLQSFIIADYPIGFWPPRQGLSFIDESGELRYFHFDIDETGITMAGEFIDISPTFFPVFINSITDERLGQFDYVHYLEYGDWGVTSIIWADEPLYDFRVLHFGSYIGLYDEPHIPIREVFFELDVLPIGQALAVEGWVPINSAGITSGISFIDGDGARRFYGWQTNNAYPDDGPPSPYILFDITLMVINEVN